MMSLVFPLFLLLFIQFECGWLFGSLLKSTIAKSGVGEISCKDENVVLLLILCQVGGRRLGGSLVGTPVNGFGFGFEHE